jgi:hypothetical protein
MRERRSTHEEFDLTPASQSEARCSQAPYTGRSVQASSRADAWILGENPVVARSFFCGARQSVQQDERQDICSVIVFAMLDDSFARADFFIGERA